jgi:DNA-binding transcriptional LysR family regulator
MPDALEMSGETLQMTLAKKLSYKPRLMECENHETVRALTEEGLGIGLLPKLVVRNSVLRGLLIKVSGGAFASDLAPHSIGLSYLKSRQSEAAIQQFQSETVRYIARWLAMAV